MKKHLSVKKTLFFLCMLLLSPFFSKAQNNKTFEIEKWHTLCRIWGLLKYNAPNSEKKAKTKADWDKILLDDIANIEQCKDNATLQKIVMEWINKAGTFKATKLPKLREKDLDAIDLSWIEKSQLIDNQSKIYLNNVRWRTSKHKNRYMHYTFFGMGNLSLDEETYPSIVTINKDMKMLTVFRLWNSVEYFFPYKAYMSKKWDDCLSDFLPIFLGNQDDQHFNFDIRRMMHSLEDGHAGIKNEPNSPIIKDTFLMPFTFVRYQNEFIVHKITTSNTTLNEIKEGDKILKINNINIEKYIDSLKNANSYTNEKTGCMISINYAMTRNPNTIFNYEILRNKDKITVKAQNIGSQSEFTKQIKYAYKILDGNIGYINLSNMTTKDIDKAMLALKNTKGLVIDGRAYPNKKFDNYTKLLSYFMVQNKFQYLSFKSNNVEHPGIYYHFQYDNKLPKSNFDYQGQITYLTSPFTQSYAETIANMFRTYTNAYFIGEQSSSTNGNITFCPLPFGLKARFTALWTGNVDGSQYQKKGIIPQTYIEYDPNSFKDGIDNQVENAMIWMKNNEKKP